MPLILELEFSGGAELLFNKIKRHKIELPDKVGVSNSWNVRDLIGWIKANLLCEREELFVQGESVRPGILVMINNIDWDLMGGLDYTLTNNDQILFISTLHGG